MFQLDYTKTDAGPLGADTRKVALALAEAIIPGSPTVRPADERTLRTTLEVCEHISPWATRIFASFVNILDRAAVLWTGKRFHHLDRHEQQTLLSKWDSDPVLRGPLGAIAFGLKFTHFDTRDVYESLGGRLNVVTRMEQPRWLSQVAEAKDWDEADDIECEVVVVGTGAGGAVVGKELADRGYAVCFVEEGKHHRRDAFTGSSVQAHFDFYRGSIHARDAPMPIFAGRLVGGSTAVNTGSCFRTPPWVLDRWCEDIGTDEFEPHRMDEHFERVERTLEVTEVGALGGRSDRRRDRAGCDALGWSHEIMRRNAPGCQGEGFCDFGCRTDARKSTNLSYIPPALEKGSMLFTGMRATRVLIERGRAVGVEGVDANGRTLRVRADAVIFSGGALPTPTFLQQQGICNSSGQVGRNLTVAPEHRLLRPDAGGARAAQAHPAGLLRRRARLGRHPDQRRAAGPQLRPPALPQTGERLMEAVAQADRMASFGVLISDEKASGSVHVGPGGLRSRATPSPTAT